MLEVSIVVILVGLGIMIEKRNGEALKMLMMLSLDLVLVTFCVHI